MSLTVLQRSGIADGKPGQEEENILALVTEKLQGVSQMGAGRYFRCLPPDCHGIRSMPFDWFLTAKKGFRKSRIFSDKESVPGNDSV